MSEDLPAEYPPEKCPVCNGPLQWVRYGFSFRFPAKTHEEEENDRLYDKYYHDAGCVMSSHNRFCQQCRKYHIARDGEIVEKSMG